MIRLLRSLARNRRLLKDFIVRDLKARYVGSSMGFFWSVVFPIINLLVFMFVFRLVLQARWGDKQGSAEVALVMLAGIVVWAAFAETVSRSTNSLVENSNLIQKVVFPSEVLPVYLTISSLINMSIGLPVVIVCVAWFAYVSPPVTTFPDAGYAVGEQAGLTAVHVTLERGHREDVLVPFTFAGTAERGIDWETYTTSPIRIPVGRLQSEIVLRPIADGVDLDGDGVPEPDGEGDETIVVRLGEPSVGKLGAGVEYTVTLKDGAAKPDGRLPRDPAADEEAYQPLELGPGLVLLPLLFLLQTLFTVGLGSFLATLNLYLRDTYHLVGVGTTVWMFATPIFYPARMVVKAGYGWLLAINPMHWLIESYRAVLLYGGWPSPWHLGAFALAGLAFLAAGSAFFMAQKRRFPDLL